MEYSNIVCQHQEAFGILLRAHRRHGDTLRSPHCAINRAAAYYQRPGHTLVTFVDKVAGDPQVGVPAAVAHSLQRLARRRVCRKKTTVERYMDIFKLWDDLDVVVRHLQACNNGSTLIASPTCSALKSGGVRIEVGHQPHQMLVHSSEHDAQDIQDAICILCGVVLQRIDHVRTVLGNPCVSEEEVDGIDNDHIRRMLLETAESTLMVHDASAHLFEKGDLCVTQIDADKVTFRWKVPRALQLRCAAHIPTQARHTLSWVGSETSGVFPAHFNYPDDIYTDCLEISMSLRGKTASVIGMSAVEFRRKSVWHEAHMVGWGLFAILAMVSLAHRDFSICGVCLAALMLRRLMRQSRVPLDPVLDMWDLFDSDEPDSEGDEDEDGDEGDEVEDADEVEDEEKHDTPPRAADLGNTGDNSSSDDINEEYLAAKKHA